MARSRLPFFFVGVLLTLGGCNGGTMPHPDVGPTDSGGDAATTLSGEWYCSSVAPPATCTAPGRNSCGVCVTPPLNPSRDLLARTPCAMLPHGGTCRWPGMCTGSSCTSPCMNADPALNYCDTMNPAGAPNLRCFDMSMPPTQPTPMMVTVWGVVDVFGTGGDSNNINVQIFEVNPDGSTGAMVGQATSDTTGARFMYAETEQVFDTSGMVSQMRTIGGFMIPHVMTDHPYIVRTQGPMDYFGHAIYDYTVAIRGSAVNMPMPPAALGITGPAVYIRPRAISNSDWVSVPSTATLTSGIPAGHGAIAGEVHDCDDVRLSYAMVYSEPPPNFPGTVYFSDNPTMPLPDTSRMTDGTSLLGIWALLDVTPGPIRVSALGYTGTSMSQTMVHLGSYPARVFPDSITLVVLRGLQPWQVPH